MCDGLKEKLQAAYLIAGSDSLHDVGLQVRDITTNPEWERADQYGIPVLAKVLSDGSEKGFAKEGLAVEGKKGRKVEILTWSKVVNMNKHNIHLKVL